MKCYLLSISDSLSLSLSTLFFTFHFSITLYFIDPTCVYHVYVGWLGDCTFDFLSLHQSFPHSVSFLVFPFIVLALERRFKIPRLLKVWFGFGLVIDVHNMNFVELSRHFPACIRVVICCLPRQVTPSKATVHF